MTRRDHEPRGAAENGGSGSPETVVWILNDGLQLI